MSNCLNTDRIRAAADREATPAEQAHADECEVCHARVEAARRETDDIAGAAARVRVPESLTGARLRQTLRASGSARAASGATTLRPTAPRRRLWPVWAPAAAIAAAVLVVVIAMPLPDAPGTISAAEVLDRSLQTLVGANGVELREFDLELRLPAAASGRSGTYRIERLVEHGGAGRYRALHYGPDGALLEGISEDPAAGRRTVLVTVDGQPFAFRLTVPPGRTPALRDLERHHVEAVIRVLQATAGQALHETGSGPDKRYVVELPPVRERKTSPLWMLDRARVVIDASGFQILELSAAGSYLEDEFSIAFRLRRRQAWSSGEVPPEAFEVPGVAAATVIEGAGTEEVGRDLLAGALRELARARR
jgi:hypothetical protein